MVIALPALVVYDRLNPWPSAVKALSIHPGQSRVCVGSGADSEMTSEGLQTSKQRSYILLPMALVSPSVITVSESNGAAVVLTESRSSFWFYAVLYVISLVFCVYFTRSCVSKRRILFSKDT